ncbi:DUF721 domain-containing protein [Serratia symbiotica]|uniref:DUF721 domain-containing protein n=1 Tax=Serratia symbiotica SCt-VLC TaxID=1347341 RepID=A0A068RAD1_9GAMM|nr:DUF721 domain-containing protein [Serratia symbiotica]CDG47253.1 Protein of unknown function (DUF721) family protein [Serratia symbiotica SCt-VLC]
MRDSRPQLLDVLFDDALTADKAPQHNVQQHALALLKLNRAVKSLLPAQLHLWCRVANIRQGILVLEAANASWMMRLRYEQPMLLSTLRAQILPSLSSIDIRINPGLMANGEHRVKNTQQAAPLRRHLSQESARAVMGLANHSPEKLRKILEQLAALAGESNNATRHDK